MGLVFPIVFRFKYSSGPTLLSVQDLTYSLTLRVVWLHIRQKYHLTKEILRLEAPFQDDSYFQTKFQWSIKQISQATVVFCSPKLKAATFKGGAPSKCRPLSYYFQGWMKRWRGYERTREQCHPQTNVIMTARWRRN